jgi:protein TonB
MLSCGVEADGAMSGCTIVSEEPVGAGYGAAALEAAAQARLSPRTVEGVAAGGTVRFTVRFRLAGE